MELGVRMDQWRYQHRVADAMDYSRALVREFPVDLVSPSTCFGREATHEMMQLVSNHKNNNSKSHRANRTGRRMILGHGPTSRRFPRTDLRNRSASVSRRRFLAQLKRVDQEDYGNVFDPEHDDENDENDEHEERDEVALDVHDPFATRVNCCVEDTKKINRVLANRLHRLLQTKHLSSSHHSRKPKSKQRFSTTSHVDHDGLNREMVPYGVVQTPFHAKVQEDIAELEERLREQRISREEASLENRVETHFATRELILLMDEVLSDEVEDLVQETYEEEDFCVKGPQLVPACRQVVDAVLEQGNHDQVLVSKFNVDLRRRDFQRLLPLQWLNDELINFWFELLKERDDALVAAGVLTRKSHFFNSFFYQKVSENGYNFINVRRWTRKIDLFALDKVFVPVNVSNTHWCLAVIFMTEKRIQYFDSMGGSGMRCLETLLKYLQDESQHKRQQPLEPSEWVLVPTERSTPQQSNGSDCGVFTCLFADYLARNQPLSFSQRDIRFHRQRMVLHIVNGGIPMDEAIEVKPKSREERAEIRAAKRASAFDHLMRLR